LIHGEEGHDTRREEVEELVTTSRAERIDEEEIGEMDVIEV
jgi:hypothetical protein